MRIISNFKDYYDGLMDHSKDRLNKLWIRKQEKIDMPKSLFKDFLNDNFYWNYKVEILYLVVAGKVYPLIKYSEDGSWGRFEWEPTKIKVYYEFAEFDKDHPEITRFSYDKNKVDKKWIKIFKDKPKANELCVKLNTPVFLIKPRYEEVEVKLNVSLKEFQFFKIMDAYTVYQELDMFVSNILVNDDMPMSPMTDLEKIDSHGFDRKTSFRKEKTK